MFTILIAVISCVDACDYISGSHTSMYLVKVRNNLVTWARFSLNIQGGSGTIQLIIMLFSYRLIFSKIHLIFDLSPLSLHLGNFFRAVQKLLQSFTEHDREGTLSICCCSEVALCLDNLGMLSRLLYDPALSNETYSCFVFNSSVRFNTRVGQRFEPGQSATTTNSQDIQ